MTEQITKRTSAPFRFDIVGSFLRPNEIKEARLAFSQGEITSAELRAIEDQEIIKLIEKQVASGLKSVTDGEFRRSWWHHDFFWGLNGVEKRDLSSGNAFHNVEARRETATIVGKITGENHPFVKDFKFVRSHTPEGIDVKQAIPAPAQFVQEALRAPNIEATRAVYSNDADLIADLAAAYQTVIADLYAAGCRTVQLDDCTWGRIIDNSYEAMTDEEKEYRKQLYVNANNLALIHDKADLQINTHVCRGNYRSTWFASGGYDSVATPLFDQELVDAYYLEYDSDRAGSFEPLAKVTDDKLVVLGLVTSKEGKLEERDTIIERIKEASQYVPLDHLCLSPQCGFSSTEEGNNITEEEQWEKIALIKSIAEEVWG